MKSKFSYEKQVFIFQCRQGQDGQGRGGLEGQGGLTPWSSSGLRLGTLWAPLEPFWAQSGLPGSLLVLLWRTSGQHLSSLGPFWCPCDGPLGSPLRLLWGTPGDPLGSS